MLRSSPRQSIFRVGKTKGEIKLKTKTEFKHSLFVALIMLASPLSYASADVIGPDNVHNGTIVTAPARYVETCKDHVCTQHQVSPAYFAVPVHGAAQVTVQEVPSTKDLFFNPDGLPAPQYAGKHVPTWDCLYHGHVLKPGGEVLRYDRETGTHWHRTCYEANGHGVISPEVN